MNAKPITLLREAAGPPAAFVGKFARLGRTLGRSIDAGVLDDRLERLARRGLIDEIPTRMQLALGSVLMLRDWIVPAAADYYASRQIDFTFHQLLRWLEEPASMVDPLGLASSRGNVIGHVMQVVHANPLYDFELLEAHEEGLAALEFELVELIEGRHPRARAIGAIVEEAGYHVRLLEYLQGYRAGVRGESMLRANVDADPRWRELERTFGTLRGAMAYFATLPRDPRNAATFLRSRLRAERRGEA